MDIMDTDNRDYNIDVDSLENEDINEDSLIELIDASRDPLFNAIFSK